MRFFSTLRSKNEYFTSIGFRFFFCNSLKNICYWILAKLPLHPLLSYIFWARINQRLSMKSYNIYSGIWFKNIKLKKWICKAHHTITNRTPFDILSLRNTTDFSEMKNELIQFWKWQLSQGSFAHHSEGQILWPFSLLQALWRNSSG